jgi:hypothetical protein
VSKGGRFGKYGETKRFARLRQSGYRRSKPPFSPLKGKTTIRPAKQSDKDSLARLSGEIFSIYGFYPSGQDALMMVNELGKYRNHV